MKLQLQIALSPASDSIQGGLIRDLFSKVLYLDDKAHTAIELERSGWKAEHMHFVSTEAIVPNSYYIDNQGNVERFSVSWGFFSRNFALNEPRKIIATTDKSLGLPLINGDFLDAYIKADGNIKEIDYTYNASDRYKIEWQSERGIEFLFVIPNKEHLVEVAANDFGASVAHNGRGYELLAIQAFKEGVKWSESNKL